MASGGVDWRRGPQPFQFRATAHRDGEVRGRHGVLAHWRKRSSVSADPALLSVGSVLTGRFPGHWEAAT